jgi:hypothetical protein
MLTDGMMFQDCFFSYQASVILEAASNVASSGITTWISQNNSINNLMQW